MLVVVVGGEEDACTYRGMRTPVQVKILTIPTAGLSDIYRYAYALGRRSREARLMII